MSDSGTRIAIRASWFGLNLFIRLVVGGLCFIAGAFTGAVLVELYKIPFWIPALFLIPILFGKRVYLSSFLAGVQVATLSELIH